MKKSFQTEMDDTQQAVSQIVCLCTTIALHQEFGVGKTRLDRITDRIHDLEDQNTEVIMTPDANGRPSKAKAEAIRESWLAGYVTSDYRIPMLRAPRGRKEQQYQIAGNKAARIAWTWIPQELFAMAPFLTSARMTSCRSVMSSYWRIGVTTSQR